MAKVNPPPQLKIPKVILGDRAWLEYERQRDIILYQLWQRTGGTTDTIETAKQNYEIISTDIDFTTSGSQLIVCKNTSPITVTLDLNPSENDELHIKRRGEEITVVGSIDGFVNRTINVLNYSMHLVYDGIDWSEI